ncbi:hypothetical protein HDU97_010083, partial [Phlyctochytrium planicorne]
HYIVPEYHPDQTFTLRTTKPLDEYLQAKTNLGLQTRPVLIGPITLLKLGKPVQKNFDPIDLLPRLLPTYESLLTQLSAAGADWIQMDEPILSTDLPHDIYLPLFASVYARLGAIKNLKILLTTYFGSIAPNLPILTNLTGIAALHIDLIRSPQEFPEILSMASKTNLTLSLGLIDGRNVWKNSMETSLALAKQAVESLGSSRVMIAPSCSLLHSPHSLESELTNPQINPQVLDWLAFATEKLQEISTIAQLLNGSPSPSLASILAANKKSHESRRTSTIVHNPNVQSELERIAPSMFARKSAFPFRRKLQQGKLNLPPFPTTTVGSFPQTKEVRVARQKLRKGEWSQEEYDGFIAKEIERCVRFQERVGLDVLVHGEFERNDMVEYFGENLEGYAFSKNGWVQSYGTRCVKPPIIYGDVSRPTPMTVHWTLHAQSLTPRPMKGMLTGPVTMLQWSFVRNDQPRKTTTYQLALALRKEVQDLERAGIPVIQIDEPAIREGLPLRRSEWEGYLDWAGKAFLLASTGVKDETQIHTHMCYSDFNDIFPTIQALDADAITIENSKSDLKLLNAFDRHNYTNGIGPGLYDIHSPRVPSVQEMEERLKEMMRYISKDLVWVNPDCGLKTRGWEETERALENLVEVARKFRG